MDHEPLSRLVSKCIWCQFPPGNTLKTVNYGQQSYQPWVTISFLDWLFIAYVYWFLFNNRFKLATVVKQATSCGFGCVLRPQILCKCVVCSSSYVFIHEYNQELPAMVFVVHGYGYELYYSTINY